VRHLFILLILILYASSVLAMGWPPPAKEKPKYKLEILKMEIVTTPSPSTEATSCESGTKN